MNAPSMQLEWVLIPVFSQLTGYSEKAVRRKIEDGVWIRGRHYRKAPDGRMTMNIQCYYAWAEGKEYWVQVAWKSGN
jgi:hypothetical protein